MMFLLVAVHRKLRSKSRSTSPLPLLEAVCLTSLAAAVAYSRVYLGYHSWAQVVAGAGIGASVALVWFAATCQLAKWFPAMQRWQLARALWVKDTWQTHDQLQAEYEMACPPAGSSGGQQVIDKRD